MSSEFQNYVPIQGLVRAALGINPTENLSETAAIETEGDANPSETLAESSSVATTGDANPSETMSESVVVTVV